MVRAPIDLISTHTPWITRINRRLEQSGVMAELPFEIHLPASRELSVVSPAPSVVRLEACTDKEDGTGALRVLVFSSMLRASTEFWKERGGNT